MSLVKLTTVLRNQVGDIHMAKVLKDGNLSIICRNEGQRDRAGRMKEVGRFKVVSISRVERGSKWSMAVLKVLVNLPFCFILNKANQTKAILY